MKRWFIARMGDYEGDGGLVPKVATYSNVNFRIWSKPGLVWCFGQLASNDISRFEAEPDIYIIPDAALDNQVSSLTVNTRNTLTQKLQAAGFATTEIRLAWTIRRVLQHLKGQLQADDNVESGDVRDIEG